MAKVFVRKPFKLVDSEGVVHQYEMGQHEMPVEHAEHWFTKAHTIGEASLADLRGAVQRAKAAADAAQAELQRAELAVMEAEDAEQAVDVPKPKGKKD